MGQKPTRGASKDVEERGISGCLSPLIFATQYELLKKLYSIEKVIGGHVKIPMGEGVTAGDGVGERVVGGAVGSAMES